MRYGINSIEAAQDLFANEQFDSAHTLLTGLLKDNPDNASALYLLGQIALKSGDMEAAIQLIGRAAFLMPDSLQALLQLAQVLADLGRYDHARSCYQRVMQKFPQNAEGYFHFAIFCLATGDKTQAKEMLLETLKLSPRHSNAMLALTGLESVSTDSVLMQHMTELLSLWQQRPPQQSERLIALYHALGKANDDQSHYAKAFSYWQKANQLQRQKCGFSVAQMSTFFEALEQAYPRQLEYQEKTVTNSSIVPIFIVGLPRSGTTLLNQMLASHPQIASAGEVSYIADVVVPAIEKITGQDYPLGIQQISQHQEQQLGELYCKRLAVHAPQKKFIVDKLPANFQAIGLIRKILPQACIIHLTRDPMAVGFSIYRHYFAENEPYFCDLAEFAAYYRQYTSLMAYWCSNGYAPDVQLSYESLVEDPRDCLAQILQVCGLNWHDDCLQFYRQTSYVSTLSQQQIRQPLYLAANEQWRRYEKYLQPLAEELSSH